MYSTTEQYIPVPVPVSYEKGKSMYLGSHKVTIAPDICRPMEQQQAILTKELADMLGFDDGVDSILQHLLTIESSKVRTVHTYARAHVRSDDDYSGRFSCVACLAGNGSTRVCLYVCYHCETATLLTFSSL